MPINPSWTEISIRLILATVAAALIGLNRSEHGHTAGFRTNVLVCLAAAISMVQVNLLLDLKGKSSDSFIVMDLMRLPLGILTGMGFIGGGAILRHGATVKGVTTAATLWFVTAMGLCFGGGQIALGAVSLGIGLVVLTCFHWLEHRMPEDRSGTLTLLLRESGPDEEQIRTNFSSAHMHIVSFAATYAATGHLCKVRCELQWRSTSRTMGTPIVVQHLTRMPGVLRGRWQM